MATKKSGNSAKLDKEKVSPMKRLRTSILLILFALFLPNMSRNVAQTQVNPPPPLEFSALTLEIILPSQSVSSLQPIPIIVKLTNTNGRPAVGYNVLGFGKSPLSIYIKKIGTNVRIPLKMLEPMHKLVQYTNVIMAPRESINAKELITLGLARYFPEPGSYEVQATLTNSTWQQSIESNVISIDVQEPIGVDRSAYNLIRASPFKESIFSGSEFGETRSTLETITLLYPNSVYARHASFVLGENYFYGRNYPQALINLVRLENDNDFVYVGKVRKYLAEIRRLNATRPGFEKPELKLP